MKALLRDQLERMRMENDFLLQYEQQRLLNPEPQAERMLSFHTWLNGMKPDVSLDEIIQKTRARYCWSDEEISRGLCYWVAPTITLILQGIGRPARCVQDWVTSPREGKITHCWTEANGMVVDATADQFMPELVPAVIIPKTEAKRGYKGVRYYVAAPRRRHTR